MTYRATLAIVLLALIPSAYFAWTARDMPHAGHFHDDGLYLVCAKALAEGSGYRILSLPGQPYQTKYPPLFSSALSLIWRTNPEFPGNLRTVALLMWLMLPAFLLFARSLFRDLRLGDRAACVLCAALVLNPVLILFSISPMSELMFSCVMLAALIVAERARKPETTVYLAVVAGLLSGVAYLTRTAALPALVTAPAAFLLVRQRKRAALFFLSMLPAVIGWSVWTRAHVSPKSDLVTLYYTDYIRYHLQYISLQNLHIVIWKNIEGILSGIGGLILVNVDDSAVLKAVSRVLAVLAIAGVVRMAKKSGLSQYFMFTAAYVAILVVWYVPANERFFIPVYPFLLAGLYTELRHTAGMMRSALYDSAAGPRAIAILAFSALVVLGSVSLYLAARAIAVTLPGFISTERKHLAESRAAFRWIAQELPEDATFLSQEDPIVYLYTGRRACRFEVPSILHYWRNPSLFQQRFDRLPEFIKEQRLSHILFTGADFYSSDLERTGRDAIQRIVSARSGFRLIFKSPEVSVYAIGGASTGRSR